MNIQTDSRWAKEIMTQKKGEWVDYLWRWGCIVTCLANIIQEIRQKTFTPKDMNDILKQINAYAYLDNPKTLKSKASFILWDKVQAFFSDSFVINLRTKNYIQRQNYYYIARVIHDKTGFPHYINVIRKEKGLYICFDVEDSIEKQYRPEEIVYFHEIIYRR